ncbi:MAG: FAD/NAD(P)-binding protein [Geminicoccaceae bacterium]
MLRPAASIEPDLAPLPAPASPMLPVLARVRRRWKEIDRVFSLDVEPEDRALLGFEPGQFNMLSVFGVGEIAVSVSALAPDGRGLIHTIRDVGAVSRALTRLGPGDVLGMRGPYGTGWPVAAMDGHDVLVLSGGLGLAPLRPAIHALLRDKDRLGRLALLIASHSPEDIMFRREVESWRRRLDVAVEVTVAHASETWRGNVGLVTDPLPRLAFDPQNTRALVCGPEVKMRHACARLEEAGLAPEAIHLSMERNMSCAVGHCGHCQYGSYLLCRDGPVLRYDLVQSLLRREEV